MELVAEIGRGIGGILFGSTEESLRAKLGEPDKAYEADGDQRLCYHDLRCAFWFHENRLHWIRCAHPEMLLFGEPLMGQPSESVMTFLRRLVGEDPEVEDYGEWESHSFPESWLELQFTYDVLTEVCLGHLFGENDEPLWPVA